MVATKNIDEENVEEEYIDYLNNIEDGAGCVEIWEHLQDREE